MPVNREKVKVRKYNLDFPDPHLDDAEDDYFGAIMQIFSQSAGFNKASGTLKGGILKEFTTNKLTIEATKEYDDELGEED